MKLRLFKILTIAAFFSPGAFAQTVHEPTKDTTNVWANESELGIVVANGNTKSESYLLKQSTSYTFEKLTAKALANYLKNGVQDNTAGTWSESEKWDAALRAEYALNDLYALFLAQSAESDKTGGIDRRYNTDAGLKYFFVKIPDYYVVTELGYRFTHEEYTIPAASKDYNFIRLYAETEKKWTPTFSSKLWAEYLPNLDESKDYHLNGEASVSAAINNIFSLKTAYLAKYSNRPPAPHKTDTLFSTSLVAKF